MKFIKGWKTVGFNLIAGSPAILMLVGQVLGLPEVKDLIPVTYMPVYLAVMAGVNLYLRSITTTPIGKKL